MVINTEILLAAYPVGSLYLTTNSINPGTLFGGTWEQITSDAYLKIVSSDAGQLGGTSSAHKIPVTSLPSHSHTENTECYINNSGSDNRYFLNQGGGTWCNTVSQGRRNANVYTGNTGGGQAYYPYYYGIYVWTRTA